MREWTSLNIRTVNYGYGWARQDNPSTHAISDILDDVDDEVRELIADLKTYKEEYNYIVSELNESEKENLRLQRINTKLIALLLEGE